MNRALIVIAISLCASDAHAHKLNIFATAGEDAITGKVYYPSGPAKDQKVDLVDASGNVLATCQSDADGAFSFTGQFVPPVTVVSQTDDGHRAEFRIDVSGGGNAVVLTDGPHAGPADDDAIRAIIQQELQPLRAQIDDQANRARLRDVIGGIGYILGIFGIVTMVRRRSRAN